jgi:hypothetical protein
MTNVANHFSLQSLLHILMLLLHAAANDTHHHWQAIYRSRVEAMGGKVDPTERAASTMKRVTVRRKLIDLAKSQVSITATSMHVACICSVL